ncbi:hypothetical protein AUR64_15605 [Haloprofundus marisrubri]|uniref:Uncharacterized protein n=1 Tax=Haloprofundus marisrubri TaxID=1514971 RepID=A0A0W1R7M6_9EURY|nr:hypothetical protein [Haloprofundus marisrubri]KTG09217.1 hypothetical protein AUR64_15605 [Haloprofundus marisrubri]
MLVDIVLEVATTPRVALLARLALGALAGLVAAVVMDVPMGRQEGGFTPAYVAASVLRRTTPDEVSFRDANVVHHGAGLLAGVLYAVVLTASESVVPPVWSLGGVDLLAHLVAVGVVVGFIYGFFAYLVLPRAGRRIYEEQSTAVRGQWLRSSLVFGAALAVVAPFLLAFV